MTRLKKSFYFWHRTRICLQSQAMLPLLHQRPPSSFRPRAADLPSWTAPSTSSTTWCTVLPPRPPISPQQLRVLALSRKLKWRPRRLTTFPTDWRRRFSILRRVCTISTTATIGSTSRPSTSRRRWKNSRLRATNRRPRTQHHRNGCWRRYR